MDETSNVIELPLFPLHTVLFPGHMLPLHIFEPRYQQMIRRCLAEDLPFGVVLIRKGQEVEDPAPEPHTVGTLARIIESTHLPDGAIDIVAQGTERFRIQRLMYDQPYLRGEVTDYPFVEGGEEGDLKRLTARVRAKVARYIELIADAAGLHIKVDEIPEDPRRAGFLAAVAMQIDNADKQRLLDSRSVREVLVADIALLNRENALLNWMTSKKQWPEQAQFGVTGTLLPN